MADLRLDEVWMSYSAEGPAVLRGLSIDVADGEFYAMVGPSGSGKTSILKVLGGFVAPDAGRVVLDGADVSGVPPERRDLGIVFQSYALFPHLTVGENVGFGLRMRRVRPRQQRAEVAGILALVGLPEMEGRYPDELSGGQQQRVALARALVTRPKALLLDEPLSALDRKIRQEMQVELRRIQREAGVTAIIVTHDQEEALALGDRLMVLDDGEVRQEGRPAEVYSHPRSRFVATFLGSANLLPGTVDAVEPSRIDLGALAARGLTLPEGTRVGDRVTVCVRPERWALAEGGALEADGLALRARVRTVQLSGQIGECVLDSALGELALTVLSSQVARLEEGLEVSLRADPGDVHVLEEPDAEAVEGPVALGSRP
ncbi:MAG: ABC transporter ATP-binding protein [Actinomycetota bacterium]